MDTVCYKIKGDNILTLREIRFSCLKHQYLFLKGETNVSNPMRKTGSELSLIKK